MWRPSRRKPLKKAAEDALLKAAADAKRVYEKTRLMRAAEVEAIVAAAAAAKEEKKKVEEVQLPLSRPWRRKKAARLMKAAKEEAFVASAVAEAEGHRGRGTPCTLRTSTGE